MRADYGIDRTRRYAAATAYAFVLADDRGEKVIGHLTCMPG